MKTKQLTKLFLLVAAIAMTGCKDPLFDGKFEILLRVVNQTESTIVVEYEGVGLDTVVYNNIQPGHDGSRLLGLYEGSVDETKPSDDFVEDKLAHVIIYRMKDDSVRQYLPKERYDEVGDFRCYVQPEFVAYEAFYELTVTEAMFTDKVVKE